MATMKKKAAPAKKAIVTKAPAKKTASKAKAKAPAKKTAAKKKEAHKQTFRGEAVPKKKAPVVGAFFFFFSPQRSVDTHTRTTRNITTRASNPELKTTRELLCGGLKRRPWL
jgi:pyocin large subunit-like protein